MNEIHATEQDRRTTPTNSMPLNPTDLSAEVIDFLTERHLATLTLVGPDGAPHVTPVGFTWDDENQIARVITWSGAKKSRLLESAGALDAVLCQVDGGRWLALHGSATVTGDMDVNADAEKRYADRYRPPGDRGAERRTIQMRVDRILGRA